MKSFLLFLCGLGCSLFFCGCINVTASFDGVEPAEYNKTPSYKTPVKFHLQKLYFSADPKENLMHATQELNTTDSENVLQNKRKIKKILQSLSSCGSVFKIEESEKIQTDIVRNFPGIFTENPKEGLACNIYIYNNGIPEERNYGVNHGVFGTLSLFSLGILPWKQEKVQKLKLHIQVENLSCTTEYPLFMKYRNSAGIFVFLGTLYLLSPAENAWFYGDAGRQFNVLSIQDHHREDFARLIVAQLCKIPAEEIEKLYLARKTKKIQFME